MTLAAGIIGGVVGKSIVTAKNTGLATSHSNIDRAPNSIAGIAARVSPSVVSIDSQSNQGEDTGSGFFLESNGTILTNNHVVEGAVLSNGKITVNLTNGKSYPATVIGRDSAYDLAVLKIDVTDAPALPLGDSDKVQVGDNVIAIGSPLGLAGTVTSGIISAKNRAVTSGNGTGESSFINAIQTDAAINPGNSGGALVDVYGNLMGINTAIFSRSGGSMGIGFAIPVSTAQQVLEGIIKDGQVTRGWIGVEPNELTPELMQTFGLKDPTIKGVAVTGVLQNAPAFKAGLRPGDVIEQVGSKPVAHVAELLSAVAGLKPNESVPFKIKRKNDELTITVTPSQRPKMKPQESQGPQGRRGEPQ